MNDVGKILVGTNAEVDASWPHAAVQILNHMQVRSLVGYEVIGVKVSFRFRPVIDVPSKLFYGNRSTNGCLRLFGRPWYDARANDQDEAIPMLSARFLRAGMRIRTGKHYNLIQR
jgi:hypothetical protein